MPETELLNSIGIIIFFATMCQYLAWKIKIPAIVLLTIAGIILGPLTNTINPSEIFGDLFHIIIEFAVVILLFEGGLNLRFKDLKGISFGIKRIISLGVIFSGVITTIAAHYVANLSWEISSIIGSILIVTGPTVIIPMLRQVSLTKKINQYLKWEGIINDALGVLIVTLIFQYLTYNGSESMFEFTIYALVKALAFAIVISISGGYLIKELFEKTPFPDFLKVPTVLSTILMIFIVSKGVQIGSGLLAVTMLGMYFANQELLVMHDLRRFKESIGVFSVSFIFIILSADMDLEILRTLNQGHYVFIALVVFILRIVSIFLATAFSGMPWRDRLLVGWFGPRGIVAASVAGIMGLRLTQSGFEEAKLILPIVFLVVCFTVLIHSITLEPLAKILGLGVKNGKGLFIIGASPWTTDLSLELAKLDVPVLLADQSYEKLKYSRLQGVKTHYGDPIIDVEQGGLDLNEYSYLLAASDNDAYNTLLCNVLSEDFESNNIFQLPLDDASNNEELPTSIGGKVLGDNKFVFENILTKYFYGWRFKTTKISNSYSKEDFEKDFSNRKIIHLLVVKADQSINFIDDINKIIFKQGDNVISFMSPE
jgi:NhaP-type Na+/H+ or K+/H+ antiporter